MGGGAVSIFVCRICTQYKMTITFPNFKIIADNNNNWWLFKVCVGEGGSEAQAKAASHEQVLLSPFCNSISWNWKSGEICWSVFRGVVWGFLGDGGCLGSGGCLDAVGPRLWGFSVIAVNRCDLEGLSEGGVTLEALEKTSKELGFEDFLRYTNMQNMHALCCVVRH